MLMIMRCLRCGRDYGRVVASLGGAPGSVAPGGTCGSEVSPPLAGPVGPPGPSSAAAGAPGAVGAAGTPPGAAARGLKLFASRFNPMASTRKTPNTMLV